MIKRTFSGIQPSGNLHIGNYLGAVKHWVKGQTDGENIFCIVDMHAITVPQDPKELTQKTKEIAAILFASGIDPEKSVTFVQSHNPDHTSLGWVLNCIATMGQMNRMTQFKDKSEGKQSVSVGLFDYPALMAADILLYDTTHVPVGEDQKQHVELARDLAEKFNSKFGDTFVVPEPAIASVGKRIMSLTDPSRKMSKSDPNPNSRIELLDSPEIVRKKIASAVTSSGADFDSTAPGVANLIDIYSGFSGKSGEEIGKEFLGRGYKEFKEAVAEQVIAFLVPFQEKYNSLINSGDLLTHLNLGAQKARSLSHPKLISVYEKVGFVKAEE